MPRATNLRLAVAFAFAAMTTQGATADSTVGPVQPLPSDFGRADDVVCLPVTVAEPPVEKYIRDAIRVFEQAGRDPRAYRLELRQEDPRGSGFRALGTGLETSVVFVPRQAAGLYPVRVRTRHPCAVSWLWHPESFTPWQRRVLRRVQELAADAWEQLGSEGLVDIEVLESRDAVAVQLWRTEDAGLSPDNVEVLVVLSKEDLEPVATADPLPLETDRVRHTSE